MIRYGSVCSGIEAATMAWHPLGWQPVFFSEIEAFPSAVLAHHYGSNMPGEPLAKNGVPNHGDFTKIGADAGPVDLLVGGTPCQSFSVAGKRLGLDDPRGNLALEYLALAKRLRARWIVWENVPGVLSSRSGDEPAEGEEGLESADFATFLSFVQQCGYGFAYRVLDAQYVRVDGFGRAVPQRRRRVFVVGYLGDWRRAAAVLLEPQGMRGDTPPRREAGKGVAGSVTASAGRRGGTDDPERGKLIPQAFGGGRTSGSIDVSTALTALTAHGHRIDFEVETFIAEGIAPSITRNPYGDHESREGLLVAHSLRAEGFDASEDGTGRGTPIVPICFNSREDPEVTFDRAGSLGSSSPQAQAVAYDLRGREDGSQFEGPHDTANVRAASGGSSRSYVAEQWAVRRLTPRECERLQGFPDNFTNVPWNGKSHASDGPRYKALGNSMAVNVMRWIGTRIDIMEGLIDAGRLPR